MRAIWKFPLPVVDFPEVEMPAGAEVLTVQTQNGTVTLWAMVSTEAPKAIRRFAIVGTGNPMPDEVTQVATQYVGTWQQGPFVWHVFEINGRQR